uniref:Thiopurine S-methyltransferase n=1 Tax=Alexandrium catenella TaxID=2925 RepID=A0A7S1WD45_ALECA
MADWEAMWSSGLAKGQAFDAAQVEPAFAKMLQSASDLPKRGRALVPGCGRGYAVAELVRAGFEVVGLELADTAVVAAVDHLESQALPQGSWRIERGDFFALEPSQGKYSMIYDCTFLCALLPGQREDWAKQMDILLEPGGELVTLIFPVKEEPFEGGPPFHMSPELVGRLLEPLGFRPHLLEPVPKELLARPHVAGEWLGRWGKEPAGPSRAGQGACP